MTVDLDNLANVVNITNKSADQILADFYKLKSSFKSLSIYEIFIEIIKNRGHSFRLDFDLKVHEEIKKSILLQIEQSASNQQFSHEQLVREAFYLGYLCSTLIHANVPVPEDMLAFGKIEDTPEEVASWRL